MNKYPSFLSQGDLVLIVSPSGVVNKQEVSKGIKILESAGFRVETAPNVFNAHYKFGATHAQRLADLQYALDHQEAQAIYCARGGFGITHIIDSLGWTQFKENPKWIIGFSDITALLHAAYQNGLCSLHASVVQGLPKLAESYQQNIIKALLGDFSNIEAESSCNKTGKGSGHLVGGNLSLLVHQLGTQTELDYSGKILFIEEVAEPLYHIDRMMLQLRRAGKLRSLAGLVVGQFTNLSEDKSMYGQSTEEIIVDHCLDYDFPIGFNFPFGHGGENMPVVHGAEVKFDFNGRVGALKYLQSS